MGVFFGTDGIRGIVNKNIDYNLSFCCGNALGQQKNNLTILVGMDTRRTGNYIKYSFISGLLSAGANVIDVGIIPSAGISYLTKELNFDYGVVITASHNSNEFNGIKIFDGFGYKLNDFDEFKIEQKMFQKKIVLPEVVGNYYYKPHLIKKYKNYLLSLCEYKFSDIKIVIDASFGAGYKIAPILFKNTNINVIKLNCSLKGDKINKNCGALYPKKLQKSVVKNKANVGFAFDGDADRLIVVDELGNVLDGDMLLFIFAKFLKTNNKLKNNSVVFTITTNYAITEKLSQMNINSIRVNVGDKYVIEKLVSNNLNLGGEQSGHIVFKDDSNTGDGIISAIMLLNILYKTKKTISQLCDVKLYNQAIINVPTNNKEKIINSKDFNIQKDKMVNKDLARLLVRASGTEQKIRIIVEGKNEKYNRKLAKSIEKLIIKMDNDFKN